MNESDVKITEPVEITLNWKWLQRIAEYYEFPTAMLTRGKEMNEMVTSYRMNVGRTKVSCYSHLPSIVFKLRG